MKVPVSIAKTEEYPVFVISDRGNCLAGEVEDAVLKRWNKIQKSYDAMQDEMGKKHREMELAAATPPK